MTLKVHRDLRVGVATHTGLVRATNEDDYLLLVPEDAERVAERGRLFVVADGMGGSIGGADASRAAVRALAAAHLEDGGEPRDRMIAGFARACRDVFELSRESPALRDMGTTLTALCLRGQRFVLGHVGDTRCLRLRGELAQLTTDHAVRGAVQHLTRCIGAGRAAEEAEIVEGDVQAGDVFVLLSDGAWSAVSPVQVERLLRSAEPEHAAAEIVRLANEAGGRDNATVVIVQVLRNGAPGEAVAVELAAEEAARPGAVPLRAAGRLQPARWPWAAVVLAGALGVLALLKGVLGIDVVARLAAFARALLGR
jgi:protein phosphatase